jgi:hypothetical protein
MAAGGEVTRVVATSQILLRVALRKVGVALRQVERCQSGGLRCAVDEYRLVHRAHRALGKALGARPLPDNGRQEVDCAKYLIKNNTRTVHLGVV